MKTKRVESIRSFQDVGVLAHALRGIVSAFGVLIVVCIAWPAAAVTLGHCSGSECVCEPEFVEGQGFDTCSMIDIAEIPYPDLPCAFRDYLGIEATYDSANELYEISSNADHEHLVVLSPQHNGYFETIGQLDDYLKKFLFGFGCPGMIPDFPEPNLCDSSTWNFVDAQNRNYRFSPDPNGGGDWSDYQPENFFNAALFNDDGNLRIDDIDVDLSIVGSSQCKQGQDGSIPEGLLEATQCSKVFTSVGHSVSEQLCDNDIPTIFDTIKAQTEEKDIKWNGSGTEILYDPQFDYLILRDVVVDRIFIQNFYYNGSGSNFPIPQYGSRNWEFREWFSVDGPRKVDRNGPEGVCGLGIVERTNYEVKEFTEAGTGQCP